MEKIIDQKTLAGMVRPQIQELARKRQLMKACFDGFQKRAFPAATGAQYSDLQIAFYAGAAEFFAMMQFGVAESEEVMPEDEELFAACVEELEAFYTAFLEDLAHREHADGKPN